MDFKTRTLAGWRDRKAALATKRLLVGFDGFVDTIVTPVALRTGPGAAFTPIATIAEFGQRVLGAAGKSTNFELYPRLEKPGGNGPIMAGALLAAGARPVCIGAFGDGAVHPVFQPLAAQTRLFSLCAPAATTALEFDDGKIMLGQMRSLDAISFARITTVVGAEPLAGLLDTADLVALLNWTMIPGMTGILTELAGRVLPALPPRPDRIFFFDLADPEKRAAADLVFALETIARFSAFGRVTLGLNLKEAQQVCAALGFGPEAAGRAGLRAMAGAVRARLGLDTVVIHPPDSAACAGAGGSWWVPGPYAAQPLLTTGAGDHFNAGFAAAQLLGLPPESCLALGAGTSGHYVRTAQSPSPAGLETFLANWK
jgi:hypothetical protein